jgi:hypothetical protein
MSWELDDARACAADPDLMPETVTIVRATTTRDSYGGSAVTRLAWVVRGRLKVPENRDAADPLRAGEQAIARVTVPWGTDVQPRDTIEVAGRRFNVDRVLTGTLALETTCLVTEVA